MVIFWKQKCPWLLSTFATKKNPFQAWLRIKWTSFHEMEHLLRVSSLKNILRLHFCLTNDTKLQQRLQNQLLFENSIWQGPFHFSWSVFKHIESQSSLPNKSHPKIKRTVSCIFSVTHTMFMFTAEKLTAANKISSRSRKRYHFVFSQLTMLNHQMLRCSWNFR